MSYALQADETVSEGMRRLIGEVLEKIIRDLTNPQKDRDKAVHEARKSCKRVRAALRLVRDEIGPELYQQENMRIRDAAQLLSGARDSWVMIRTLDRLVADHAGQLPEGAFEGVRARLVARYEATLAAHLEERDVIPEIVTTMQAAIQQIEVLPIRSDDFSAVSAGLRRVYFRGRWGLRRAYRQPSMEAFHEWRKRVKYLWYQLEILMEVWPNVFTALAEELHTLSEYLGDDHDLAVLRRLILVEAQGFEDRQALLKLVSLIDQKRLALEALARPLGERLYYDPPRAFIRRVARYWESWQEEQQQQQSQITQQIMRASPAYLGWDETLLTTAELAANLEISTAQVRRLIHENKLPAEKVGPIWVIRAERVPFTEPEANELALVGELMSTAEAAEQAGLAPAKIRDLIQAGQLPATRAGRNWVILEQDLRSYVKAH